MKEFYEVIKDFVKCFILPLSLFTLFKASFESLFVKFIIKPLTSNCYPANIRLDVSITLMTLAILIPFLIKIFKGAKISNKLFLISFTYFIVYVFYRTKNSPFAFTETTIDKSIKLTDVLNSLPLILMIVFVLQKLILIYNKIAVKEEVLENGLGFTVDEVTKIDDENDILSRGKFIDVIATKIKNTESKNASFAIGVVAKWGAGKSTFICTLLDKFESKEFIKIELNVWKCSNNNQIIETLFKQLKLELKNYSFSINNKLQDYTSNLLKGTKNENLNTIKNLAELILPDTSLEKQYESINDEIKRINKKIIIVIDDLDRLDKNEIYEVIRLVRNTANFANTFFIVAYDRNYILNAIEDINPYQTHYFLEKIFQIEFSLPIISDSTLKKEISRRLELFLTDKGKIGYKFLQEKGHRFFEDGDADLTSSFIHNLRDVVRFVNSFKLSYEFVKDQVYFTDFYNLELIKFKHPDLFSMIYKGQDSFFTTDRDQASSITYSGNNYTLAKVYENGMKTEITQLKKFIENEKQTLKLNDKDIDIVCNSFNSIFSADNNNISSRKENLDYHLSVLIPSMFDRYFILGIEGKLCEIFFSKMRQMKYEDLISELEKFSLDPNLTYELRQRLEKVKEFDSKNDFMKVVKAIFHFADLPNPNKESNYISRNIGFSSEALAKVIGNKTNFAFFDNKDDYKRFLIQFLINKGQKYQFSDEFLNTLIRSNYYFISELFEPDEIRELILNNFKDFLKNKNKLSLDIWWHFTNCELRFEKKRNSNVTEFTFLKNKEALPLMRKFIYKKDLDSFLHFSIRNENGGSGLSLNNNISNVFKSEKLFIWMLKRYKGVSNYKDEFLRFYEALTNDKEYKENGVPQDFFKVIPVSKRIDE